MMKGMTAQYLFRQVRPLEAGETILYHAAAGGVGLIACQLARALGVTMIGTVSTDAKAEAARANGCAHVIVTSREDIADRVREITGGKGVPVVYELGRQGHADGLARQPAAARRPGQQRHLVRPGRRRHHAPGDEGLDLADPAGDGPLRDAARRTCSTWRGRSSTGSSPARSPASRTRPSRSPTPPRRTARSSRAGRSARPSSGPEPAEPRGSHHGWAGPRATGVDLRAAAARRAQPSRPRSRVAAGRGRPLPLQPRRADGAGAAARRTRSPPPGSSRETAWRRWPGTATAMSSSPSPPAAPARSCTRSTRFVHPDRIVRIVDDVRVRIVFFDLSFMPLVEEIAPRLADGARRSSP